MLSALFAALCGKRMTSTKRTAAIAFEDDRTDRADPTIEFESVSEDTPTAAEAPRDEIPTSPGPTHDTTIPNPSVSWTGAGAQTVMRFPEGSVVPADHRRVRPRLEIQTEDDDDDDDYYNFRSVEWGGKITRADAQQFWSNVKRPPPAP